MIPRLIQLPRSKSFFLFGPRGRGKSTLLRSIYTEAPVLDLLKEAERSQKKDEVDFVLYGQAGFIAIEVKRSGRFREQDLSGLREFVSDYPAAKAYLLYGGSQRLRFGPIEVLPLEAAMKDWLALINPNGSAACDHTFRPAIPTLQPSIRVTSDIMSPE